MKTEKKSIFLKLLLIAGCGIFFYPTISDAVNGLTETTGIVAYNEALTGFESVQIDKIREGARAYNEKVRECEDKKITGYEKALNPFSTGMMGSLYIPKIEVNLPIYHDVNEGIIQNGVGHLPGTSLPIGGSSTHCVLSTHSGLPKAKLFTDLHKLDEGDEFILSILGENLYYRVVMIKIVLPTQTSDLKVVDGKDYVTLTTCTPYGINTHRLLVRGERVSAPAGARVEKVEQKAKDSRMQNVLTLALICGLILLIAISILKDLYRLLRGERKQGMTKKAVHCVPAAAASAATPAAAPARKSTSVGSAKTAVHSAPVAASAAALARKSTSVERGKKEEKLQQVPPEKVRRGENRIDRNHIAQVLHRAKERQLLPR
ncbi:MAG: class C sortase [Lachnospiraceae bacterium]|nr:class C sortase [Lachnospiraceae bacterium]